jgi:hypothetical protein
MNIDELKSVANAIVAKQKGVLAAGAAQALPPQRPGP